jgi:hypothetical protein
MRAEPERVTAGVQGGAHLAEMRRLRVAVERMSRASTSHTRANITLMVIQIVVAVWQKVAP